MRNLRIKLVKIVVFRSCLCYFANKYDNVYVGWKVRGKSTKMGRNEMKERLKFIAMHTSHK